jgi:NCAIR mutase (PurE)-related protein
MPEVDDLGFATVDIDRLRRRGMPEVIYCPGKTPEQVLAIMRSLRDAGQNVFATRATAELYETLKAELPDLAWHAAARALTLDTVPLPEPRGRVTVVCAGTSDLPVAEEAALSAERLGARVARVFDVGVAGLHRVAPHLAGLRASRAVIVVAGMEGALPSVVAGLIDRPVIAVPTSVGYGTSLNGIAALLGMLNTCVPGVTVVNIDNGFGAGIAAGMINRTGDEPEA